jgi:hypothetical protein
MLMSTARPIFDTFLHQLYLAREGSLKLAKNLTAAMTFATLQALGKELSADDTEVPIAIAEMTASASDQDGPTGIGLLGVALWIDRRMSDGNVRFEHYR